MFFCKPPYPSPFAGEGMLFFGGDYSLFPGAYDYVGTAVAGFAGAVGVGGEHSFCVCAYGGGFLYFLRRYAFGFKVFRHVVRALLAVPPCTANVPPEDTVAEFASPPYTVIVPLL